MLILRSVFTHILSKGDEQKMNIMKSASYIACGLYLLFFSAACVCAPPPSDGQQQQAQTEAPAPEQSQGGVEMIVDEGGDYAEPVSTSEVYTEEAGAVISGGEYDEGAVISDEMYAEEGGVETVSTSEVYAEESGIAAGDDEGVVSGEGYVEEGGMETVSTSEVYTDDSGAAAASSESAMDEGTIVSEGPVVEDGAPVTME